MHILSQMGLPICSQRLHFSPDFCQIKKTLLLPRRIFFLRVPGLEPGAFWFVAKRSIQLGYIRLIDGPKIV